MNKGVELGQGDLTNATWGKSSYSTMNGNCVEVATNLPGKVGVRDSKDSSGPKLVFSPGAWKAFTEGVRSGKNVGK